jgi:Ca-activated chloride channel family protein
MIFAHPLWLLAALVTTGVLYWVSRRYDSRRRAALEQFVSVNLRADLTRSVSHARIVAKRVLFAASLVLLCVALAEPQAGFRWEQVKRRGHDIIFAVDTSRSMLTPDVKPNRLARAKLAIDDFVSHLNGDAVGLVAFAGSAFLQTPITLDYGAFHESLNALDTNIIPRGGTDITSAIQEADAALQHRAGSDKVMILVTDGEDLEGNAMAAAKAAAKDGLKIFTVGVGSANGELIPLPADQGGGFLKDNEGHLVKSRLDESALKALAEATGGSYAPLGADNEGLDTIYREALVPLAKHDLESRSQKIYTEQYQWPLGAALALLMCSLLLGTRRRVPAAQSMTDEKRPLARFALPSSAAVLALMALLPFHAAHASPASAAKAYAQGNFTAAERDYMAAAQSNAKQPILQYNEGAAAYKAGEFAQAARAFQASLDASPSGNAKRLAEQEDAYYNLGNTLYREGQKTQQGNAEQTIQTWTQAIKAYDAALQLRAEDVDSKFNRDLVSRKLAALKQEQSQKKPPEQSPQSQKQSSKPQQGQQNQGKDNQGKDSQGKDGQGKDSQGKDNSAQSKGQSQGGQPNPQANGQPQQASGANQNPQAKQPEAAQAAGQKNEPSSGAAGSQPRPDRSQGDASAKGEQPGEQTAQRADEPRVPGQMSKEEARELLDSVKDEEHRAPAAPVARNGGTISAPDEPVKDW